MFRNVNRNMRKHRSVGNGARSIPKRHIPHGHAMIFRPQSAGFLHCRDFVHQREQTTRRSERLRKVRRQSAQRQSRAKRTGKQHERGHDFRRIQSHRNLHSDAGVHHETGYADRQEGGDRSEQHHQNRTQAGKIAISIAQTSTVGPQRARVRNNHGKTGLPLPETDDLPDSAHVIEHLIVECGGFRTNPSTQAPYREREEFGQNDSDRNMRDDERDRERGGERGERNRVYHGGRHRYDDR